MDVNGQWNDLSICFSPLSLFPYLREISFSLVVLSLVHPWVADSDLRLLLPHPRSADEPKNSSPLVNRVPLYCKSLYRALLRAQNWLLSNSWEEHMKQARSGFFCSCMAFERLVYGLGGRVRRPRWPCLFIWPVMRYRSLHIIMAFP